MFEAARTEIELDEAPFSMEAQHRSETGLNSILWRSARFHSGRARDRRDYKLHSDKQGHGHVELLSRFSAANA